MPSRGAPDRAALRRRPLAWPTWDRKTRALFWTLVTLASLLALLIYAAVINVILHRGGSFVNFVFLFWGWSRFIHEISPASLIYAPHVLFVFEQGLVGAPHSNLPFAYPPSVLLLIWPLAWLGPVTAWALWLGVGLALYLWAGWQRPWGARIALLGVVAPSTVAAVYAAQTSLLAAALMIGGCRLVGRRPVWAGVLFGLLAAVKPQYGLLVPVALVSARQWRCVVAAGTTVALAVLASAAAFGWGAWMRLPGALTGLSALVARHPKFDYFSPTVTSGLRMLGAGPALTAAVQLATAAGAAVAVWLCFRRGFTPLGAAALMVGAFLVTPYALYYDLPMVSYAVLSVVLERDRSRRAFTTAEVVVLVLAMALPVLMWGPPAPWGMIVLGLLFVLIVGRIARLERAGRPVPVAA